MNKMLEGLRKSLIENKGDAVLISSEINQRYVSEFDFSDGYIFVLPNKAYIITDFRYVEAAKASLDLNDFTVICAKGSMIGEIMRIAEDEDVYNIFIEEMSVSCGMHERFRSELSCNFKLSFGASAAFSKLRAEKSDSELLKIAKAQAITDKAFEHILSVLDPKMTEVDVALELEFFMRKNGAEGIAFDTIAVSGSASSLPHGVPRNLPLEKGFLTMDFGAVVDGYCSDMTRTVVIGRADDEMKRLYNTVLTAQRAALEFLSEGVSCRQVDKIARDIINGAGYEGCFGHSLGHGIGMVVHEAPRFAPSAPESSLLSRGNVMSVEPGIYIEGKYGCRIEDMIAVNSEGKVINMTHSPKELIEIY